MTPPLPPHELLKIIASTISAIGVIGGAYALLWRHFANKTVRDGIKKLKKEDLTENEFFKSLEQKDAEIITKLDSIADGIDKIDDRVKGNSVAIKRQELLFLIQTEPRRVETIEKIYSEYSEMGGNNYVSELVEIWREMHAKPEIEDRLPSTTRARRKRTSKKGNKQNGNHAHTIENR